MNAQINRTGSGTIRRALLFGTATLLAAALLAAPVSAQTDTAAATERYLVVLDGTTAADGSFLVGGVGATATAQVLAAVRAAGGTVTSDLSRQIGVLVVDGPAATLATALARLGLVDEVAADWSFQGIPSGAQMAAAGRSPGGEPKKGGGGADATQDPLESQQWDMRMISAPRAHEHQAGWRKVDVGVLDSGIDGNHLDFKDDPTNPLSGSNVDCERGRDFTADNPPADPSAGMPVPAPCADNQFHGTHVAGTIAAQANGFGIVGVAPNVTLVPVKVCDTDGHCYVSDVLDGLAYAGDAKLDVINMSFFVDDDIFQESTEFKCSTDPTQRAFRTSLERALAYAHTQGVVLVAALGNSDQDLAHPVDENGQPMSNDCEVVPAESDDVIGTVALGAQSEKADYSNYGAGAADISAPGGNGLTGDCSNNDMIFSTFPANTYACISGTSMASPHAAGLAALIVSQYGQLKNGDVVLSPDKVAQIMKSTAVDIGLRGVDECFGSGRIDAFRAVTNDTSRAFDASAPLCPEYTD